MKIFPGLMMSPGSFLPLFPSLVDLPSKYICLAILLTVCFSLNTFCDFILVSEDLFILICSSDFLSYMSLLLDL